MEYGKPVAVLIDGAIRFGVITEIVERTNKAGINREVLVECFMPDENRAKTFLVPEDHIEVWNHWSNPAEKLMDRLRLGKWAMDRSAELLAPTGDTARVLAEEWGAKSLEAASTASDQVHVQEPVSHLPHHPPVIRAPSGHPREDIPF